MATEIPTGTNQVACDFTPGYYASVETEKIGGIACIIKSHGEKSSIYSEEDARQLQHWMEQFDATAEELGVPTARPIRFDVATQEGKVRLIEVVPLVGGHTEHATDLQYLFEHGHIVDRASVLTAAERTLELHRRVAEAGYPISLDAVMANFCLNREGQLVYIDKMPPRQRLPDGTHLLELPMPTEPLAQAIIQRRHFTPAEHGRVVYTQGLRTFAKAHMLWAAPYWKELIGEKLGNEVYQAITMTAGERERVLTQPNLFDIDALRQVGWEAHAAGQLDGVGVHHVHSLAHIHFGGKLPEMEHLYQAAAIIREPANERSVLRN